MISQTAEQNMANRATVTFHTTPELKERLDKLATVTRRSKSFLTNEAVERYLEAEEDFVSKIMQGIEDADAGRTYTSAEMKEHLYKFIEDRAAANRTS
jgi:predicted transcriptional regulator